ncbi:hypothetical protein HYDPIDRAFT_79628 [Hydnomerulius pinastri MD-312]|nr:hypothetical protein HYDPIDRAFT_79628 [Hydnomerulius pinastri MD-312]
MILASKSIPPLARRSLQQTRRSLSTASLNLPALNTWISSPKSLTLTDTLTPTHLASLYVTLPTRDGSLTPSHPYQPPREGDPLGYGHHLVFFHPRNPESVLRPDGTDADFCPPEPFTRRMWASGSMWWTQDPGRALRIGDRARAVSSVVGVETKGIEDVEGGTRTTSMVFVRQRIEVGAEGRQGPGVIEERSHVYLASGGNKRIAREVPGLPKPDFSFTYKPSLTTLFRFSALTFNGHHIHLDKDYAQKSEGYPERLVHGPLTALMLLEALQFHKPGIQLRTFAYRARNPVIVNRTCTIHGAFTGENTAEMWCVDEGGVVGMTGRITFSS